MLRNRWILALFALTTIASLTQTADAHPNVGIRIGIGFPGFYYGPGPYYYGYRPYPYYYYPPPPAVIYESAPPVVIRQSPPPAVSEPLPVPVVPNSPPPPPPAPLPTPIVTTRNEVPSSASAVMAKLNDGSDTVRRDAAVELGRLKATYAVDVLMTMLAKDSSPVARDGAARALGLIAERRSLNALIFAAQADDDREVRRSAQFAVEAIRSNLRGN